MCTVRLVWLICQITSLFIYIYVCHAIYYLALGRLSCSGNINSVQTKTIPMKRILDSQKYDDAIKSYDKAIGMLEGIKRDVVLSEKIISKVL
jgi:hypothetical protein